MPYCGHYKRNIHTINPINKKRNVKIIRKNDELWLSNWVMPELLLLRL